MQTQLNNISCPCDPFWVLEQKYKMLNNKVVFKCSGFTNTHTVLQGSDGIEYHMPKNKRHFQMYKKI